jgi:hypothetical protein
MLYNQMLKKYSKLHVFLIVAMAFFSSCIDREDYPIEPYIEFKDFYVVTDETTGTKTGVIVLFFTDGDGDIGLSARDTIYPFEPDGEYYNNFMMNVFKMQGSDTVRMPYNMRIPPINPDSYSQNLKGEMYIDISIEVLLAVLPDKKFQFEAFIYDKALHRSNLITSPVIQL